MITSILSLLLAGALLFYSTSNKTVLHNITPNIGSFKLTGSLVFLIALSISILHFGTFAGFLFWLISTIIILSLVIVIYPLKIVNYKHLLPFILFTLILEIISMF